MKTVPIMNQSRRIFNSVIESGHKRYVSHDQKPELESKNDTPNQDEIKIKK